MEADLYTLQIVGSGEWRVHLRKYFLAVTPGNPPALCRIATNQQDKIPPQHQSYSPGVDQGMSGQAPTQQEMENISNHAVDAG